MTISWAGKMNDEEAVDKVWMKRQLLNTIREGSGDLLDTSWEMKG